MEGSIKSPARLFDPKAGKSRWSFELSLPRSSRLLVLGTPSPCIITIDVLASADADLRFQMEEAGVSADVQKAIFAEGFTSVRVFAGLEEYCEGVQAALKSSFKLDGDESPAMHKEIALLVAVWEGLSIMRKAYLLALCILCATASVKFLCKKYSPVKP